MVDFDRKIFYLHVPKCAGTSVKSSGIFSLNSLQVNQLPSSAKFKSLKRRYKAWLDDDYRNYFRMVRDSGVDATFKTFAVVRNPWDRILSYWSMINTAPRQPTPLKGLSFKDFVCKYLRGLIPGAARDDWHVLSANKVMSAYEDVFQTEVGLVFDVTDMEVMLPCLCDYLGIEEVTLPRKNVTVHKHFSEYYDNYMQYIVGDLYKEDINIFGYEFS